MIRQSVEPPQEDEDKGLIPKSTIDAIYVEEEAEHVSILASQPSQEDLDEDDDLSGYN